MEDFLKGDKGRDVEDGGKGARMKVNRTSAPISQPRGRARSLASARSNEDADLREIVEHVVEEHLDRGQWRRNGRNTEAIAMVSMLRKFELVPMRIYFMMFA